MRATHAIPLTAPAIASIALAGCGSSDSGASSTAPVRAAAANTSVTCANRMSVTESLLVRNALDVPVRINSGSPSICDRFSETGNPTAYNGTTIPAGGALTMRLQMTHQSASWRVASGTDATPTIGSATVRLIRPYNGSRNGNVSPYAGDVRFDAAGEWVMRRGIGSLKRESGTSSEVELVGSSDVWQKDTHRMTIAYMP